MWGGAGRLVLTMCLAEVVGMAGFATFAALLPDFLALWTLSNTEAGWISGIFFAGYVAAVPVLVSLTDRVDPRRIYLWCTLISAASALAFALAVDGFWSALVVRALAGVGLAGTYMPGLKILSDRLEGARQSRATAFYTASFGIGVSLSYLLAGELSAAFDWRWAFAVAAVGSLLNFAISYLAVAPAPVVAAAPLESHLLDFRPVLRNRRALAYIIAYAAHNWELFGLRSWIVAYLAFSLAVQEGDVSFWSPPVIAAAMNLLGWPASVFGNELATRFGRARVVAAIMIGSALVATAVGFSAALPFGAVLALCFLHAATVAGESGSVTAGTIGEADPRLRGATMAVHTSIGFLGAFFGPLAVGVVLDLAGGGTSVVAWGLAYLVMALGVVVGPLAIAALLRGETFRRA